MMTPEKIDRYDIISEVGRGGMSTVYHGRDPRFAREVAVKVLPRVFLHDPLFRTRFEREARTIATIEHPAIVPVYDFGEDNGQPFLVMRFMKGGSLGDRLDKAIFSLRQAAYLINHLAPAIDKVHQQGIIHRDLKPDNILFDEDNNAYIADFGIAKITEASISLTGEKLMGTLLYMSPEHLQNGKLLDGRSDIYSLGVILFQMLTGRLPYEAAMPTQLMKMILMDPVPNILEVKPGLPTDLKGIIEQAMAKDRDLRFNTAEELAFGLNNLLMIEGLLESPTDSLSLPLGPLPAPRSGGDHPSDEYQPTVPLNASDLREQTLPLSTDVLESIPAIPVPEGKSIPESPGTPLKQVEKEVVQQEKEVKPVLEPEENWGRRFPIWVWVLSGAVLTAILVGLFAFSGIASQLRATPTPTASPTISATHTMDSSQAVAEEATPTPEPTHTETASPTATDTPEPSPTPTFTPTPTSTPTATFTSSPTVPPPPTQTPKPTEKPDREKPTKKPKPTLADP